MNENFVREIFYFENYYLDFFESLKPEVKKKFNWTLQLIATIERVPENTSNISQILREFMKFEWRLVLIFIGFSVFSTRGI